MTDNEREAIAILQHTGKFYGQVSNLIKVKDERWVLITKNLSLCAKEVFKRSYICTLVNNSIIYTFDIGMDKDRLRGGSRNRV